MENLPVRKQTSLEAWIAEVFDPSRLTAEHSRLGRPVVTLSYAQSLDGSIAARRGFPLALSGPESLTLTHRLRSLHDAILVGIGTVLADDPRLTVRLVEGSDPQPVVVDSQLRLPLESRLMQNQRPPWVATREPVNGEKRAILETAGASLLCCPADPSGRVNLPALLKILYQRGIHSLMVEGGSAIITAFLSQNLVDYLVLTVAPVFVGGLPVVDGSVQEQPGKFHKMRWFGVTRLGEDLILYGDLESRGRGSNGETIALF